MFIYLHKVVMCLQKDMLNKNTLGVKKSARPIRSSPTYVRPKAVISAEAKKSPSKMFPKNYLNEIQQFYNMFSQV